MEAKRSSETLSLVHHCNGFTFQNKEIINADVRTWNLIQEVYFQNKSYICQHSFSTPAPRVLYEIFMNVCHISVSPRKFPHSATTRNFHLFRTVHQNLQTARAPPHPRGNSKLLALLGRTGSVNKGAAGSKFDRPISSSDITDYCQMPCSES